MARQNPSGKEKLRLSLSVKMMGIIVLSIVTVSTATNYLVYRMGYNSLKAEIRNKLTMIAAGVSVTLDTGKLQTIRNRSDEGSPAYLELQRKLQAIQQASQGKLRYIYTVAKTGRSYVYILDAVPIGAKDHSAVGDPFKMEEYPDAVDGFSRPTADREPLPDPEFGIISQSGYAPIRDSGGRVIGMLGVDMDVSTLRREEQAMVRAGVIALIASFILALALGWVCSGYLTQPILLLTQGTEKVAGGDLKTRVAIRRRDELGDLAESFNVMTADLRASHEALTRSNSELEEKVRQRTAALSKTNQEITDILDNMSQAIFTIDRRLLFNPQHSRYALEIFGPISFAGRNLLDLLFPEPEQAADRANFSLWLDRIFSESGGWANLEPLQPIREMAIRVRDGLGRERRKYIRIDFRPIFAPAGPESPGEILKLMMIVQDISEQKLLALEMEQKELEYRDNINQIVEVIKLDQELFQDFIDECRERLREFEPKLIRLQEERDDPELVADLFRIMHTIKGNARFFKLERVAGEAHAIESIFAGIAKGESVMTEELLTESFRKLDRFNLIFQETWEIYQKIIRGTRLDTGKTRNLIRTREEGSIIKVRVEDLNRLTELISQAGELAAEEQASPSGKGPTFVGLLQATGEQLVLMRRIPLARLFTRFPRMVRDIAGELGKEVRLITRGEELKVDKKIFDNLGDPLVHLIRNALDHGIETPDERGSVGKSAEGTLEIGVEQSNSEFWITVKDDGRGLDLERIKAKAVTAGLITPEKGLRMTDQEAMDLIFLPGFSTNERVTTISGRGVGMDVVKTTIERELGGSIQLDTIRLNGMTVTIHIPAAHTGNGFPIA